MSEILQHTNYLFVFAHPDDEVYSCGLMHQLVEADRAVSAAFITSGDAGGSPEEREAELKTSMDAIGISEEHTHLLRFPEAKVLESFSEINTALRGIICAVKPDCIVGMDYEGGHEVHDSASFVTSHATKGLSVVQYVFPVYHAEDGHREAASFVPGREATDTVQLSAEDLEVKIKVLEAHKGQIGHFLHLQRQSSGYFQRLFTREIFRETTQPIDYATRPVDEIGYESHRNGFKFEDFKHAVGSVSD